MFFANICFYLCRHVSFPLCLNNTLYIYSWQLLKDAYCHCSSRVNGLATVCLDASVLVLCCQQMSKYVRTSFTA